MSSALKGASHQQHGSVTGFCVDFKYPGASALASMISTSPFPQPGKYWSTPRTGLAGLSLEKLLGESRCGLKTRDGLKHAAFAWQLELKAVQVLTQNAQTH